MTQVDECIQRVIDAAGQMLDSINQLGPETLTVTECVAGLQAALLATRTLAAAVLLDRAERNTLN